MAQSVKRPTLDFGSGHDLLVLEMETEPEPRVGGAVVSTLQSLLGIVSLPLSLPLPCLSTCLCILSLNLKINKLKKKKVK